ncbi:MAG: xanthine dehydrogenase family protein subunit M [Anaerolineales bacterium]|nr:xanthine dehydrogenase family protein subunit M [Anaerolineales bacterium]
MKPPSFEYFAPTTTAEALALLAQHGYEAKPLAGGQSLIPTMNFRLAQPGVLIDLNPISELAYIRPSDDGGLRIGTMTRQRQVERDPLVAERAPLIHETMPYIAHPQIRNRGTFGGSLAHADPAAELPAVTTALNARFRARSQRGERWLAADEFFVSLFATALEPDELLVEIALPPLPPRSGWAFTEMSRRHGDYALVGVAAVVTLDERDRCQAAKIVFLSVGDGPVEAQQAAQLLIGQAPSPEAIRAAAETAAQVDIAPNSDIHASAEFRCHLARVLAQRVLTQAVERAKSS